MENNKGYLKQFGLIFLIAVLSAVFNLWLTTQRNSFNYSSNTLLLMALQAIPFLLSIVSTGIATEKWKAAGGAVAIYALTLFLQYFLYTNYKSSPASQGGLMLLQLFLYLLPFMAFFLLATPDKKKLRLLIPAVLLLYGTNSLYHSQEGFNSLSYLLSVKWKYSAYVLNFIGTVTSLVVHVILLCELLNYGQGKANGFHTRILNPGNDYSKLNATIVYWSLKTFIWLSAIGSVSLLRSYFEYHSGYYLSSSSFTAYLKWYYLFSILFSAALLIAAAWYLRKFLLEYFISYNFSSRFLYWFLLLPVLGIFAWLVMLPDREKQARFEQRKKSLEDFSGSSTTGIVGLFLVFLVLRLLISVMGGNMLSVITTLISAGFFFALVSSRTGYYVNLYLNFILLAVYITLPFIKLNIDNVVGLLFPLSLLNTVQLVLIYPALHFDAFDYISYEEDKLREPEPNLF